MRSGVDCFERMVSRILELRVTRGRQRPAPWDPPRTPGIGLLYGPTGKGGGLMSETSGDEREGARGRLVVVQNGFLGF